MEVVKFEGFKTYPAFSKSIVMSLKSYKLLRESFPIHQYVNIEIQFKSLGFILFTVYVWRTILERTRVCKRIIFIYNLNLKGKNI